MLATQAPFISTIRFKRARSPESQGRRKTPNTTTHPPSPPTPPAMYVEGVADELEALALRHVVGKGKRLREGVETEHLTGREKAQPPAQHASARLWFRRLHFLRGRWV